MMRTQTFFGKEAARYFKFLAMAAWLPLCVFALPEGRALADEVRQEGDSGDGTLRGILATVGPGGTITFASDVQTIALQSQLASAKQNLILQGNDAGFKAGLTSLLTGYGLDRTGRPNPLPDTFADQMIKAIKDLHLPEPAISWGGADTGMEASLISLSASSGITTIQSLFLQNAKYIVNTPNKNVSDSSAETGTTRYGGALRLDSASSNQVEGVILNSAFLNNSLEIRAGDAIANGKATANVISYGGGAYISTPVFSLTSSVFSANTASAEGGLAQSNTSNVTATATVYGGGLSTPSGANAITSSITSSIFSGNTATAIGGRGEAATTINVSGIAYGGGLQISSKNTATITSSIFSGNTASADGGDGTGGKASSSSANTSANGRAYGGGAYISGTASTTITSSIFFGNTAKGTGGSAQSISAGTSTTTDADAYAYGGGVYISNSTEISIRDSIFSGNAILASTADGKAISGSANSTSANASANAGARAQGGGAYLLGSSISITGSIFSDNTASVIGGNSSGGSAQSSSTFANASANSSANIYGGGGFISSSSADIFIMDSIFSGNTAKVVAGKATGGSSLSANAFANTSVTATADIYGAGAYISGKSSASVTESIFSGNTASAIGGEATGVSAQSTNSSLSNNANASANANASGNIYGGGASISSDNLVSITSSVFSDNTLSVTAGTARGGQAKATNLSEDANGNANASAKASGNIYGGGGYISAVSVSIEGSRFSGNTLSATGGTASGGTAESTNPLASAASANVRANASATSYGGGAFISGDSVSITNTTFSENTVSAIGGALAQGGTGSGTNAYTWASADAYAFGAGLYLGSGEHSITDSSFLNNSVHAQANGKVEQNGLSVSPQAEARGGALFVDSSEFSDLITHLELVASAGKTVEISGNTANDKASGIHFGRGSLDEGTGYFSDSAASTIFTVRAQGNILMLDPLSVELYRDTEDTIAAFAMNVQAGGGVFVWGEKNVLDANGGSIVSFEKGSNTVFTADFTLTSTANKTYRIGSDSDAYLYESRSDYNGNDLVVVIEDGATLSFHADRDPNVALFDFTNSTSQGKKGSFQAGAATLNIISDHQILSVDSYLIADGIHNDDRDAAALIAGTHIAGFDTSKENQYWALVEYDSPYQPIIDEWHNLINASDSLQTLLYDKDLVSSEDFLALTGNLTSATADHTINQTVANLQTVIFVPNRALELAFVKPQKHPAPAAGAQFNDTRFRVWGGYIGRFVDHNSHSGYHGYDQDVHGALAGVNVDFTRASIGMYAGYTNSQTDTKEVNSKVDSDGYHLGLLGKFAPVKSLPKLAFSADLGWSHFANEGERYDGTGRIKADFDQEAFTFGLGVEYGIDLNKMLTITPFIDGRYAYLDQEAVHERDGLTATHTDSTDGYSLTTNIGAKASLKKEVEKGSIDCWFAASWQHEYGDRNFTSLSRYIATPASGPLPGYDVSSVKVDSDTANIGVGLKFSRELDKGREMGLNLGYNANIGGERTVHAVSAIFELSF